MGEIIRTFYGKQAIDVLEMLLLSMGVRGLETVRPCRE